MSVLAGQAEFMNSIARGEVVHAGTMNGNPLCLAAARATIETLAFNNGSVYQDLRTRAQRLRNGIRTILEQAGFAITVSGEGPVFQLSFMKEPARKYRDTLRAQASLYAEFALGMLDQGVLLLPDGRWYLSTAHSDEDIDETIHAVESVCKSAAA